MERFINNTIVVIDMRLPKSLPEVLGFKDPLAEDIRDKLNKVKDQGWATMETVDEDDKTEALDIIANLLP